jgi:phosphotransferase system HPr (HPr) family protein
VENLTTGRGPADAKSGIGLLTCGVSKGHRIRISAEGPDEEEAVRALCDLVASGTGEPLEAAEP